jgi:hypothetical protein
MRRDVLFYRKERGFQMFDDLLKNHRIFVNTAEHDIVEYERIEGIAKNAAKDTLVHMFCYELDGNGEVESNVDVWMYRGYEFGMIDPNVYDVSKDRVSYFETDSLDSCIEFITRNS